MHYGIPLAMKDICDARLKLGVSDGTSVATASMSVKMLPPQTVCCNETEQLPLNITDLL